MNRQNCMLVAMATALLTACGGGGGDSSVPVTYNAQAAYKNLLSAPRTFTLSGKASNGGPLGLVWTITPIGAGAFPLTGAAAQRVDSSVVVTGLSSGPLGGTQQAYLDSEFVGLGAVRPEGSCTQSSAAQFPTAATVGQTGSLGTSAIYQTCTPAAPVVGTLDGTWSIQQANGMTFVCSNSTQHDSAGAVVSSESDCIEASPDGTLGAHAVITVTIAGSSVVFAN